MRILRVLAPLIVGGAVFALLQQFLHVPSWLSVIAALLVTALTFLAEAFDFAKKPLELRKLWFEGSKLQREVARDRNAEREAQRLVHLPTPEEVKEYGASLVEREIRRRYRREERLDRLPVKPFIADLHEEDR
jgi:hypothetical protein